MQENRRAAPQLIVGLGNPGSKYENTRHNLGFLVVRAFANKHGFQFKPSSQLQGEIAIGKVEMAPVILLLPTTYMNLSGISLRKCADYYKIPLDENDSLIVVMDDVYLKYGTMRFRKAGSSGGHNGLKSIEEHLKSQQYARLRMGIGPEKNKDFPDRKIVTLEEYVLGKFTDEEIETLPTFVMEGVKALESWLKEGKIE